MMIFLIFSGFNQLTFISIFVPLLSRFKKEISKLFFPKISWLTDFFSLILELSKKDVEGLQSQTLGLITKDQMGSGEKLLEAINGALS